MKEIKKYTAAEIARYHAGKMSAQEMHAIEKAALQDPFLADAIEGYEHTPHFKEDVEEIQQRLAAKTKQKKVFLLYSLADKGWGRVAALVIIFAGVGYFFYTRNDIKKENLISQNERTTIKADTLTTNKDSTATNDVAFENSKAQAEEIDKASTGNSQPTGLDKIKSPKPVTGNNIKSKSFANSTAHQELRKVNASEVANENVLAGRLTDQEGNAVPFATITDIKRQAGTVTDSSGSFSLKSQDTATIAIATAPGYESKNILLKRDEKPTIEMKKSGSELNQVVVTGMGVSKKAKVAAPVPKELSGKVPGVAVKAIQPSGGQEKFVQYLQKNLKPVYNEKHERLTGEVTLSFTLNKKGQPENIKVVKSSCNACETEATRLLQNGPSWVGKIGESGTVVIKF
jgi:TonB family protein